MKRDPLIDDLNRLHRRVTWKTRLTLWALSLASAAFGYAVAKLWP